MREEPQHWALKSQHEIEMLGSSTQCKTSLSHPVEFASSLNDCGSVLDSRCARIQVDADFQSSGARVLDILAVRQHKTGNLRTPRVMVLKACSGPSMA